MYQTSGVLEVLNLLQVCGIASVEGMSGAGLPEWKSRL